MTRQIKILLKPHLDINTQKRTVEGLRGLACVFSLMTMPSASEPSGLCIGASVRDHGDTLKTIRRQPNVGDIDILTPLTGANSLRIK